MEYCIVKTDNPYYITEILQKVNNQFNNPRLSIKSNKFHVDGIQFFRLEISHLLNDNSSIQECKSYIETILNE